MASPIDTPTLESRSPADEAQAERDRQLAASLSNATPATRTRSGTLIRTNTDEATSGPQGNGNAAAAASTPVAHRNTVSFNTNSGSESRRRPSFSQTRSGDSAVDAMGHLADDLAREDREEEARLAHEHEREHLRDREREVAAIAAVRARRQHQQQQQHPYHGTPQSVPRSAIAARMYRQQNVSDSSIDSNGGAFIDHRRQPHSLSFGTSPRNAGAANMSARSPELVAVGSSARKGSVAAGGSGLRRYSSSAGEVDDSFARSPKSPRALDAVGGSRGYSVSPDDAGDRDGDMARSQRPVHFLDRHPSQHSLRSQHSGRSSERGGGAQRESPYDVDMSRPGSGFGKPEDDICFPAHGAAAELDYIDMRDVDHHHHGDRHIHGDEYSHPEGVLPLPGVLPNFPFPFDFNALEDFAEHEREGMPIPRARKRGAMSGGEAVSSSGGDDYGVSSATAAGGHSFGPNSYEPGTARGGMGGGRRRRMSEGVTHHGRMRRKLALFEGAGDDLGGAASLSTGDEGAGGGSGPRSESHFGHLTDTKTPLLADKRGANGYGAAGGPDTRKGAGARPYRFSFYSNALPTTIHSRSLAELPAEGQTFEELFCGTRPSHEYEVGQGEESTPPAPSAVSLDARLSNLASSNQTGGSGTATPTSIPNTLNNVSTSKLLGTLPAGVSATTMRNDRPKTAVMRSDEDAEANTWWLDVTCPTDQEMKTLSKVFGIHPLTTEDIQMEETREKIELFRNYYFVCFRSFEQDPYSPTYLEPLNMYIIVFREGTLSFHFRGTPHPQNVRRRIKQLKDYINVTSDWISYALIDDITDAFGPLIQNIEYEVDSIDELVLILKEAEQSDMLRRIGTCRKKVMGLLRLMGNKADVVKGLSKRCNENWSVAPKSDIGLYLSDIQDHITTSTQNLTHYEKILSRSHSNYLAQISIEMTDANNQINDVLSKLTALGTVLIPMNLVTGLWGMNVNVPGQEASGLNWFFGILGCLAAFALVGAFLTYRFFVRR
ncbi:hypothetical protein BMF94_0268 [Rhodotorula taiwanensis]|uniref:Uncharacterized protein n=1 Tax=Rhodotorula taiwanensis TaxID=741276 RepID=A0A2S5BIR7_9BASI|nr:hypothetical protein BMF94_0268 [Rhodotorula taiwanensis]